VIETTAGRVIFNQIWPEGVGFFNKACGKKQISDIIFRTYQAAGHAATVEMLDRLKDMGFMWHQGGNLHRDHRYDHPTEKQVELDSALQADRRGR
jgi:DNA-directed RNA polymerase subunit beta'